MNEDEKFNLKNYGFKIVIWVVNMVSAIFFCSDIFATNAYFQHFTEMPFFLEKMPKKSFVLIKLTTHSSCLKCCYRYTWLGKLLQANIFFHNRGWLNKLVGRKCDASLVFQQGVTSNRARLFRFLSVSLSPPFPLLWFPFTWAYTVVLL